MRHRAFALVLSLFLVALLLTTGAGLTLTAVAESVVTASVAHDLDHTLAVDSLLVCLPQLVHGRAPKGTATSDGQNAWRVALAFGNCQIHGKITSEQHKYRVGVSQAPDGLMPHLQNMARQHGLPEGNVKLRPIVDQDDARPWPRFVWFDQIVEPTELEEVFHLTFPETDASHQDERASWSDVISFWKVEGGLTYAIEIETGIEQDLRRWYVVVSLRGDDVEVLYRGAI